MTEASCPFAEILEKRVLGDSSEEDDAKLLAHLEKGCPSCAPRYSDDERMEQLLKGALRPASDEAEARKTTVLAKLGETLAKEEELRRSRRMRRVGMNAVLFVTILAAVSLIAVEYLMTIAAVRRLGRIQRTTAETESQSLLMALDRYARETGALPQDGDLLKALSSPRHDGKPFYPLSNLRLKDGSVLDPWGRPYIYRRTGDDVTIRSRGPNGEDEGGAGDDVSRTLIYAPGK